MRDPSCMVALTLCTTQHLQATHPPARSPLTCFPFLLTTRPAVPQFTVNPKTGAADYIMPTSPDLVAVEAVAAGLVVRDAGGTDIQGAIPAYITQDHFHRWVPALVRCRHSCAAAGTAGQDKRGV